MNLINCAEMMTGPDRKIDLEIWNAVFPEDANPTQPVRSFTGSIDAAMTLVPEPHIQGDAGRVVECRFDFGRSSFYATVNFDFHGRGKTPATALCSAALRARAAAISSQEVRKP